MSKQYEYGVSSVIGFKNALIVSACFGPEADRPQKRAPASEGPGRPTRGKKSARAR